MYENYFDENKFWNDFLETQHYRYVKWVRNAIERKMMEKEMELSKNNTAVTESSK